MEKDKEALLEEIERLLNFDGGETEINPDYLAYFTLEELHHMVQRLKERQEKMVEEHRDWMMDFVKKPFS
jgi:hypothetical protein